MRKPWLPLIALAALSAGLACNKKSPDRTDNTASPSPRAPARPMTPKNSTCGADADCALTIYRHENCCIGCGLARGVLKDRATALATWHRANCNKGGYSCPKVSCATPPGKPVAKCRAGRCTVGQVQPRHVGISSKGHYTSKVKLPPRTPCKKKADCGLTRAQPGKCCPVKCPLGRVGGTVAWVKAQEKLRAQRCTGWLKTNGHRCSRPKCYPKGTPEARCEKARCKVHYKPLR